MNFVNHTIENFNYNFGFKKTFPHLYWINIVWRYIIAVSNNPLFPDHFLKELNPYRKEVNYFYLARQKLINRNILCQNIYIDDLFYTSLSNKTNHIWLWQWSIYKWEIIF